MNFIKYKYSNNITYVSPPRFLCLIALNIPTLFANLYWDGIFCINCTFLLVQKGNYQINGFESNKIKAYHK